MAAIRSTLAQMLAKTDRPGVRAFFLSMAALSGALLLALYSSAAAELGQLILASTSALVALAIAGWVAVTLVPALARRTPLRWIGYKTEYTVSREGWVYFSGLLLVALAALNTGNNLLYIIVAAMLAAIAVSGFASSICLYKLELDLKIPDHIFAGTEIPATVSVRNPRKWVSSLSVSAVPIEKDKQRNRWRWVATIFPIPPWRPPERQWLQLPGQTLRAELRPQERH